VCVRRCRVLVLLMHKDVRGWAGEGLLTSFLTDSTSADSSKQATRPPRSNVKRLRASGVGFEANGNLSESLSTKFRGAFMRKGGKAVVVVVVVVTTVVWVAGTYDI
jgi:hypothetical protein